MNKQIVNIDGKKFTLDVDAARKSGNLVPVETITTGQYYENIENGEKYILASIASNTVALISLTDGNRYMEGVIVKSLNDITSEEFDMIRGNDIFDRVYLFDITNFLRVGNPNKKKN